MKKVFTTLAGFLALNSLVAQQSQPDSLKNIQLEEVVVSATRATANTPVAFSNIKKEAIEKQNFGQDIPYIMALTPSVTTTSDAGTGIGYTGFRIRGTDITRINVTINGIPYNDSESQGSFFVDLPDFTSSLSSMQIQRGVGTSTNGGAAFGASVNMKTDNASMNPYANIGSSFGSFNTWKNTVEIGTGIMQNRFAVDGRFSTVKSDGFIDRAWVNMYSYMLSASYITNKTLLKFITFGGNEKSYQAWNGVDLDLVASEPEKYTRHYNELGKYTDDNGQTKFYDNQIDNYTQTHYQLLLTQVFSPSLTLNGALHYTKGEGYYEEYKTGRKYVEYLLTPPVVNGEALEKTDLIRRKWLDNDFYGMTFALNKKKEKYELTLGGGANKYDGNHFGRILWVRYPNQFTPGKDWYRSTSDKSDMNIYLKATAQLTPHLVAFGDVQYRYINYQLQGKDDKFDSDKNEMRDLTQEHNFSFFNPKAGLTYNMNANNSLYASFAVANREPNRTNYTDAGPNEKPTSERLYDTEAGYRYQSPNFSFGANFYYMKYKNQLILTGKISEIGELLTTNIPDSYRTGIELTSAIQLHRMLRWDANATFSRNKINDFTEQGVDVYDADWNWIESRDNALGQTDIAYSPNIIANSILTFTYRTFEAALQSSYVSRQYIDNTSSKERSIDPYFVNNLRLGYSFRVPHVKSVNLGILVNNLFNVDYETNGYVWYSYYLDGKRMNEKRYFPQAGTNVLANVTIRF
ncbi:MAG: TonB-dependent receptor [Petrimonas sp.]|nr:TonB-dependent receptor [Petrimonas sp.]